MHRLTPFLGQDVNHSFLVSRLKSEKISVDSFFPQICEITGESFQLAKLSIKLEKTDQNYSIYSLRYKLAALIQFNLTDSNDSAVGFDLI